MFLVFLLPRKLQGFEELCARNRQGGQKPIHIFSYATHFQIFLESFSTLYKTLICGHLFWDIFPIPEASTESLTLSFMSLLDHI